MTRLSASSVFVAVLLAVLALSAPALAQEGNTEAMVRVAHLSPDAPEGTVYVDGEPIGAFTDVPFGAVSPYVPLPAGETEVQVYPSGETPETADPALEADVDLEGGASYTFAAVGRVGDDSLTARLYEDDHSPPAQGHAKLRVVHAVPDVGPATVGVEGVEDRLILPGFSNASGYAEVPAGVHTLEVTPAGAEEAALSVPDVPLSAGGIYSAFAVGRAADGSIDVILIADSAGDANTDTDDAASGSTTGQDDPAGRSQYGTATAGSDRGEDLADTGGVQPFGLLLGAAGMVLGVVVTVIGASMARRGA